MRVTKDMLSPYCKQILKKYIVSIGQVSKLVPTLANKETYVLHYRNLQLYLELDLKLKTIYRALEFDQSPWLAQYIDYNTKKRMQSKNAFGKEFFKLMKNSVFGESLEARWCAPCNESQEVLKDGIQAKICRKLDTKRCILSCHKT